ncbi:MAG: hypothetical protein [Caudoviricetes sp.]|nr:MAG: hypothetical protein [Caudoviricetes sp.]
MKPQKQVVNNYVAKYANEFNKAQTHTDKKKADKRGYEKHKGNKNVLE